MKADNDFSLNEGAYTLWGDDERGYDFVTVGELYALRDRRLSTPGVLSLYLDITPQRLAEVSLAQRVETLLKVKEEKLAEPIRGIYRIHCPSRSARL